MTVPHPFEVRALEIHNSRMWRWSAIEAAIAFMSEHHLNTLVLHQNDLIDQLVLPPTVVDPQLMYTRWPILRSMLYSHRLYFREVIRLAAEAGVTVFVEVKELSYPEQLLELKPELRSESGAVCPTHPFWPGYIAQKLAELLRHFPGLGGVIVSLATRESKASIATRACTCSRCEDTESADWYEEMIRAFHGPLEANGKTLVVRDFAYTRGEQSVLAPAAARVSGNIVLAVKNVPHDFWPTFPHNPLLRHGTLRRWVELDVFGQYTGFGVVPCDLSADIRARLAHCADVGVSGAILRSDWEMIDDTSALSGLGMLNLVAAAMILRDPNTTVDSIYEAWARGGLTTALRPESIARRAEVPRSADAARRLRAMMEPTWDIVTAALFTRGHVFQYSSRIAPTLEEFFYVATVYHSREPWDPGSTKMIEPTDANVAAIVAEKREAQQKARSLRDGLDLAGLGLPVALQEELAASYDLLVDHVDLYAAVVIAGFTAASALADPTDDHVDDALASLDTLATFRQALEAQLSCTRLPFYCYWLFDTDLLCTFEEDVRGRLAAAGISTRR